MDTLTHRSCWRVKASARQFDADGQVAIVQVLKFGRVALCPKVTERWRVFSQKCLSGRGLSPRVGAAVDRTQRDRTDRSQGPMPARCERRLSSTRGVVHRNLHAQSVEGSTGGISRGATFGSGTRNGNPSDARCSARRSNGWMTPKSFNIERCRTPSTVRPRRERIHSHTRRSWWASGCAANNSSTTSSPRGSPDISRE